MTALHEELLGDGEAVTRRTVNALTTGSNPVPPAKRKKRKAKSPFLIKLIGLRFKYGNAAAAYFENVPICEDCGDARIALLTVHHVHGRSVDEFRTLCFNCHMLEHSANPDFTYEDHRKSFDKKELAIQAAQQERETRTRRMIVLRKQGHSLRSIGREVGVSYVRVKVYLDREGAL